MADLRRNKNMPLTAKGMEIKKALTGEYGAEKGEQILYAGKNKGTFTGIDAQETAGRRVYPSDKESPGKYNAEAVQKAIERDPRIKPGEAKKIHALLKGWRGDGTDAQETAGEQASEDARMSVIEGRLSGVERGDASSSSSQWLAKQKEELAMLKKRKGTPDWYKEADDEREKELERRIKEAEAKRGDAASAGLDPAKLDAACSMVDSLERRFDERFARKDATGHQTAEKEKRLQLERDKKEHDYDWKKDHPNKYSLEEISSAKKEFEKAKQEYKKARGAA
jgi:hypothetical protein